LDIGSCNTHLVHNAFKNGTVISQWHVDSFCLDLYSWFKCSPARQEDFKTVLEELDSLLEKTILYFSITRWVLMGKVVNRILSKYIFTISLQFCSYLDQWEVLSDYFLRFLPAKQPSQSKKNKRYDAIKLVLSSNLSKVKLNFILYLCENIFDRFLTYFQSEEPLIHLLYHEMTELYRNVLLSFLKPDVVQLKSGQELLNITFDHANVWRSDKDIRIGKFY
jgi:hypothetical protein